MLLPQLLFLILLLEEVVAGDGESSHQHDKLVKIHLVVLVGVQVVHDFLHQQRIFLGLQTGEENISFGLFFQQIKKLGISRCRCSSVDVDARRGTAVLLRLRLNIDPEAAERSLMLLLNDPWAAAAHHALLISFIIRIQTTLFPLLNSHLCFKGCLLLYFFFFGKLLIPFGSNTFTFLLPPVPENNC